MNRLLLAAMLSAVAAAVPSAAVSQARFEILETASPEVSQPSPQAGVPVYAGDITDRPYEVIGEVRAGVRKATIFSRSSSEAKIYRELWERAVRMGADAVIFAQYGEAQISLDSWGKTPARGTAIRFINSEEAAPAAPSE